MYAFLQRYSVVLALLCAECLLIVTLYNGGFVGYPLLAGWALTALALYGKGYSLRRIGAMSWRGAASTSLVLQIFLFIGCITSLWQSAGTLPTIVVYILDSLVPSLFLMLAFIFPSIVSYIIGSSLGTVGTIGLPLILMARLGGVPVDMVAGAIIAGAYVGDRGSPMSSSASLVASLTQTDVPGNVRPMFRTALPALLLSLLFFGGLSLWYPLNTVDTSFTDSIGTTFVITPILLLPAIAIIVLVLCKVKVRTAMFVSALTAFLLALFVQHRSLHDLVYQTIFGFYLPDTAHPLYSIFKGGGLVTMIPPGIVIIAACSLSGLLEESGQLAALQAVYKHCKSRTSLFLAQCATSFATAGIGSNQSVAVVMNYFLMRTAYREKEISPTGFMLDIENSAIVISALLPWNIAALVPTVMLDVSLTGYLPYAIYLYLLPLCYWWQLRYRRLST